MEKDFKFINQKDIYQYKFYMIPKELFVNERYISLSPAAILLYGILLDRLTILIIKILIKLIRIIAIMNKDNIQKNF